EAAVEGYAPALDTAIVRQHLEDWMPKLEVGANGIGAPERPGPGRLAQHVEPGSVVDLPVHEHDCANCGVTRRARGLKVRIGPKLGEDVGRGVDQSPGGRVLSAIGAAARTVGTDGDRGLRPRAGP